jgi:hypothetical protein
MAKKDKNKNIEQFIANNPEFFENTEENQNKQMAELKRLGEQAKIYNDVADRLAKNLETMQKLGQAETPSYQATLQQYQAIVTASNTVAVDIARAALPPEQPTEDEIVTVPDFNDPSGFVEVAFEPGRLDKLMSDPNELFNTIQTLRQSDKEEDNFQLRALGQVMGDDVINRMMLQDTLSVQGEEVTERPAPMRRQNNDIVPAQPVESAPLTEPMSVEESPEARIRANIETSVRRNAAQRREDIELRGV